MKRQAAPAATFLVLILLSLAATADVIYVDHTGGGDYLTIQEGVNAASEGDTVLVSCGTYYEHDIEVAPGICLTSETGFADCVIVDAEALGRVLHCVGGANTTVTIVGFTLANGRVVIPGENTARGGGMSCDSSLSPTVVRCTFTGNHAESYVGKGGGLFCGGSATITDCVFSHNSALSTSYPIWYRAPEGGGARIEGVAIISGCVFESNVAACDCGGLYIAGGTITDCSFVDNGAGRDAGAFYSEDTCSFSSCVFSGNWSGGIAGAVWCSFPGPVFTDCTFSGNSSEALRLGNAPAEITNCSFVGNASPAIRENGSSPIIQRTIIAFTEGGPGLSCSGTPLITQCCIFGNAGGDSLCGDYHDNMFQSPLFCGAGSGDYTLHAESPCLPTNNPWGVLIGAHGQGCGPVTTWYVDCANSSGIEDGSEAYPFDTIREGIDAATEAHTVLVAPGTYVGSENRDLDFGGINMAVRGTGGAESTTIDCEDQGRAFYFASGEDSTSVVDGFTITNGYASEALYEAPQGGGIYCNASSPILTNLVFLENAAESYGGGVYCTLGASPILRHVSFIGNNAYDGGGMNCLHDCFPVLTDVLFEGNSALSGGGFVAGEGSGGQLTNVTFESNHADLWGGAASIGTNASPVLTNVTFSHNVGTTGGGVSCTWNSNPVFMNVTFIGNQGTTGGGLYCLNSSPILTQTIIAMSTSGGAVVCHGTSEPTITHSCIFGNVGGDGLCGDYYDNVFEDPLFCPGEATLQDNSPCLPENNEWGELIGAHGQGCGPVTTWYVDCANSSGIEDGSEAYPFDTIREGIDAATEAHTVLVAPGTYVGSGNRDLDFGGINMTLRGTGGAESTTIDCEDQGRAFHFVSGEDSTSVIDGFMITNGYASDAFCEAPQGGGIYCNASSPILTDLVFIENAAESYGGGVYCTLGASPILRHVSFIGNSAYDGGGMDCRHDCFPVLMDVLFEGNSALSGGGFVAGENCGGHLTNVTFESNHADLWGGAASIGSGSSPVLTNVTFSHNDGRTGGGVSCTWSSNPVFVNVTFIGNHGVTGGGLHCLNSSPSLTQTIIAMSTSGSAVVCEGTSEPTITHSCIFGNAGGDGLCGDYYDNMFEDPLFCLGEATLHDNSPCLPENNEWGELIGAHGAGGCGFSPVDDCFFATATSSKSVVLRWTVGSLDGIEGFEIYRGTSEAGPFAKVNETPIPPALPGVYEDATVWPATTFWYELRTVLTGGSEEIVAGSAVSATTGGELLVTLYPPRPNPFTDEVHVRFDVPGRGEPLSIGVYNVRGQLVKMLVRGSPSRGRHEVTWDGTGTHGLQVSSGVYLLRLHVGEHKSTRRILLVR